MRTSTKSRNGCVECRARRIKCDEATPSCFQCQKKRIPCPGYKKSLKWLPWDGGVSQLDLQAQAREPGNSSSTTFSSSSPDKISASINLSDSTLSPSKLPRPIHGPLSMQGLSQSPFWDLSPEGAEALQRKPIDLVKYYFDHVCPLFSAFDGVKNPFRTTLLKIYPRSALISSSIQGLAAACLVKAGAVTAVAASNAQREAFHQLHLKLREPDLTANLDEILLGLLLTGSTTTWHSEDDLGCAHYRMAASLVNQKLNGQSDSASVATSHSDSFYSQALIYWWMLLCFATDEDLPEPPLLRSVEFETNLSPRLAMRYPHPWTGVSPEVQLLFGKVGKLIVSQRVRRRQYLFVTKEQVALAMKEMEEAAVLERALLSLALPEQDEVVDSGDPNAPQNDFVLVAESYRVAGLLLLYRTFPDLLDSRLPNCLSDSLGKNPKKGVPIQESTKRHEWLSTLAVHGLGLLENTQNPNSTQAIQPLLVLALGCELRFPAKPGDLSTKPANDPELLEYLDFLVQLHPGQDLTASHSTERQAIQSARECLQKRVNFCRAALPTASEMRMANIIEETHRRMDDGDKHDFWIDIMLEKRWTGIFG